MSYKRLIKRYIAVIMALIIVTNFMFMPKYEANAFALTGTAIALIVAAVAASCGFIYASNEVAEKFGNSVAKDLDTGYLAENIIPKTLASATLAAGYSITKSAWDYIVDAIHSKYESSYVLNNNKVVYTAPAPLYGSATNGLLDSMKNSSTSVSQYYNNYLTKAKVYSLGKSVENFDALGNTLSIEIIDASTALYNLYFNGELVGTYNFIVTKNIYEFEIELCYVKNTTNGMYYLGSLYYLHYKPSATEEYYTYGFTSYVGSPYESLTRNTYGVSSAIFQPIVTTYTMNGENVFSNENYVTDVIDEYIYETGILDKTTGLNKEGTNTITIAVPNVISPDLTMADVIINDAEIEIPTNPDVVVPDGYYDGIMDWIGGFWDKFSGVFDGAVGGFTGDITGILDGLFDGLTGDMTGLFGGLGGRLDDISGKMNNIFSLNSLMAALSGLLASMVGTGELDYSRVRVNSGKLTTVFPFCIPFDFVYAITNLYVEPQVPIWEIDLSGTVLGNSKIVIDMTPFEPIAKIVRFFIYWGFAIGLMVSTRKFIKW